MTFKTYGHKFRDVATVPDAERCEAYTKGYGVRCSRKAAREVGGRQLCGQHASKEIEHIQHKARYSLVQRPAMEEQRLRKLYGSARADLGRELVSAVEHGADPAESFAYAKTMLDACEEGLTSGLVELALYLIRARDDALRLAEFPLAADDPDIELAHKRHQRLVEELAGRHVR